MKTFEIVMPGKVEAEALVARERELATPAAGQARVEVEAAGVSFAEVQMRRGRYPGQPAFPFVPGYDLVGRVREVGAGVDRALLGARVAAMTEHGAWATQVILDAADLIPVPETLDAGAIESLVVNGVTAYKMLHRVARVRSGQTVVITGAAGGVGTVLLQLARLAGVRAIGTCSAAQADAVRALGGEPIDYRSDDVLAAVRRLAPDGVAAVFDHVGGDSLKRSFAMLARGGTLVSYGNASTRDATGSAWAPIVRNMVRAMMWNLLPGGRRVRIFDVWGRSSLGANRVFRPGRFRAELRADLDRVLDLLGRGELSAQVARRVPLRDAGRALAEHERGGLVGKIVLVPA
jgi:NADPH:quinone reductase-like Zn-dependent oxidoreductase